MARLAAKSSVLIVSILALAAMGFACRSGRDKQNDVSKQDIAAALTSFMEAFVNNDAAALPGLFSKDCTAGEVSQLESGSRVFHQILLGGQYQLTVNTESLVIETKDDQVTVPLDQPEGVLTATSTVNGQQGPYEQPLAPLEVAPLVFAREDGAWKVHNCGELFRHGDETPATAIP